MPRVSAGKLLGVALEAARQGSVDCDESDLNAKDVGLLNEQWTQSYVGDAISRYLRSFYQAEGGRPYVTYETTVSWLEYFFDQKRSPGPVPGKLSDRRRFDLSVWSKSGKAIGVIEIKNEPLMSGYSKSNDPGKIVGALRRWQNLQWGMFIFCVRNNTKKEGSVLAKHLKERAEATFDFVQVNHRKDAKMTWQSATTLDNDGSQCLWAGILFQRR